MAMRRTVGGLLVLMVFGGILGGQWEKAAFGQLSEPGKNLVTNPSFEDAQEKSPLPAAWNGSSRAFQRDVTVTRSGKASLKYGNTDPKQYLLCSQKVPLVAGCKYRFGVWAKTQDIQGSESGATICLEWQGKDGKHLGGSYPAGIKGTKDWSRIEEVGRLPEGATACSVRCYVRREMTGTAWFDEVEIVRVTDPPMQSVLCSPVYRGRVTPAGPKELRVRMLWNLADHDLKPQESRVRADLLGPGGKIVQTTEVPFPEGRPRSTDLTVPATGLEPGRYDLAIRLEGPGGKELQTEHHAIERLSGDAKVTCAIDEHRRMLVEGKPFFPIGMYFHGIQPKDIERFAQSKFNCLMPYGSPNREQMDQAQKQGLKVIYSIKDFYAGTQWSPKSIRTVADEEPLVRARVREHRHHPALLAWYLNDELSQKYMPQLESHQRWVMEEDPNHPTWVVLYQYQEVAAYLKTFDVIGTDPYPISDRPASMAGQWTTETFRQTGQSRPLWQVPQVFNWANYAKSDTGKQRKRTPTLDEIRSMAWQCVCEGATGLVFYSWMDLKRNPDAPFELHWEGLKRIAAEIDQRAPILLSIEPAPALAVEHERPRWLHWLVRKSGDKLYLFVVNNGDGEGTVSFTLPSVPKSVRVLGEDRPATVKERLLSVELPRLAVRCCEIEFAHP